MGEGLSRLLKSLSGVQIPGARLAMQKRNVFQVTAIAFKHLILSRKFSHAQQERLHDDQPQETFAVLLTQ